jgi:hypothetical protein
MNKYAKLAMNHWAKTDPDRYATIADPQAFFQELGEQAETQIQQLAERLAGPDQPGEEYLQKVGRLNMARLQAEEAILAELVLISGPEEEIPADPTTQWVTQTMREMAATDEDDATED